MTAARTTGIVRSTTVTNLRWGIKASFVDYVRAVGGSVETDGGARGGSHAFLFPAEEPQSIDGTWRFTGAVRLQAHDGLLDVRFADPWVRAADGEVALTIAGGAEDRLTVARGRAEGDAVGESVEVALAPEALHLFDFTYPAGTPLAALLLSAPLPDPAGAR